MKAKMRNNSVRRALAAMMFVALLLPAFAAASAAGDARINLESANISGDVLQLIFYSGAEEAPSQETLSVSIDGSSVAVDSINTIDYADPGTSYLFLFDTNTAVTERALPDMQTIARGLIAKFGAQDNALIVPIGQAIDVRGFTDDKNALNTSIEDLQRGYGKTDLYSSISEAVKLLENDATLRPRRCLVVMADGLDNTAGGISSLEVSTQVSQCHVPLYVVALTYSTGTQERIDAAKEISGIARLSPGGISVLLKNDGVGTSETVERILAQRTHTYLATIKGEVARGAAKGDTAEVTLTQTAPSGAMSATRQISIAALPTLAPTIAPTPESTATPQPTPAPTVAVTDQDFVRIPSTLLYAAGAAVAAIIVAAILVMASKKRRKQPESESSSPVVRFAPPAVSQATPKGRQQPAPAPQPENPMICIVRLGEQEDIVFEGTLQKAILLGDGEGSPILPETAAEQAKTHLIWRDGTVWAMQNREGVLVNGAQARTNACLNIGDVLRVGDAEYRIFYSAN